MAPSKVCAVDGRTKGRRPNLKHYSFPKEKHTREIWIQKCESYDNTNVNSAAVCEEHSSKEQRIIILQYELPECPVPKKVRELMPGAKPDISLPAASRPNTSDSALQGTDGQGEASPQIQENKELQEERQQLEEELLLMDQKLKIATLTSASLDEKKTRLYTGLPSLATFTWLVNLMCGCLESFEYISKPDQLLVSLMKLKLDLDTQDLAFRFNISRNTVCNILSDAIPKMACKLKFLISWPTKKTLLHNMPRPFRSKYKNCCVIIDCFEFPIEKPLNMTAGSQTWSDTKQQHTIKCLLGITPYGSVSYVSQCWGGRISDRDLFLQSGFLDKIHFGDRVMTCKDFFIDRELSRVGGRLIIPEFKHLHGHLVSNNHELSAVCIYIKKAFKRIKVHRILSQTLPIYLLPYVDEVLTCCLALSNLQLKSPV